MTVGLSEAEIGRTRWLLAFLRHLAAGSPDAGPAPSSLTGERDSRPASGDQVDSPQCRPTSRASDGWPPMRAAWMILQAVGSQARRR